MTKSEARKLIAIIRTAWPLADVEDVDAMVEVYHLGLRSVSYPDAEAAVVACIETCRFMPVVAEIRERLPRSIRERVEPAWEYLARTRGAEYSAGWRQANQVNLDRLLRGDALSGDTARPALKAVS